MEWQNFLLICAWTLHLVNGQPPPIAAPGETAVLVENANKFIELYGFATQLMNLGGSLINNAKDHGGNVNSGNGILGDVVRPQLRGVRDYDAPSFKSLAPLSDYGGGALGSSSGRFQSAKQSGLETLLNTFLGSSVSSPSSPNIANFFAPSYPSDSSPHSSPSSASSLLSGGTNIDSLINTLIRSGAKQVSPDLSGTPNLLSQFFG